MAPTIGGMLPSEARERAHRAASQLRAALPGLLSFEGVAMDAALEQQLFFALRDDRSPGGAMAAGGSVSAGLLRASAATVASLVPRRRVLPPSPRIAVLVRETVHLEVLDRVASDLAALGGPAVVALLIGRAAEATPSRPAPALRLTRLLHPAALVALPPWNVSLAVRAVRVGGVLREVADPPAADLITRVTLRELPRIALGIAALNSAVRRLQPRLLAAFDEVGTWARILPGVATAHRIGSLDIPHAEAADAIAIRGAAYDRLAVYGPRAASVLREAGIAAERIVEVGAPRFDLLVGRERRAPGADPPLPRRIVFAAQYPAGALTQEVHRAAVVGAVAAAEAVAPAELVVRPHPAGPRSGAGDLLHDLTLPTGVTARVEAVRPLHELLEDAWLLVTAWSNSVFEAALVGVPSLAVVPAGVEDPVRFADQGLALGAQDGAAAAAAATRLLEPDERRRVIDTARSALAEHIGPRTVAPRSAWRASSSR